MVPLNCLVCSLLVGLDQWLFTVSSLWELVSMFWWVQLDLVSLERNEACSSEFWGDPCVWHNFGQSIFNVHDCVPVLLEN